MRECHVKSSCCGVEGGVTWRVVVIWDGNTSKRKGIKV